MKKIMITGSNGLLGQKILEQAGMWKGFCYCAISRSPDRFGCIPNISFNCVDICNKTELEYIVELEKPDCIIHTAAMTKPDECELAQQECWKINVEGTENIIACANKINAQLIYLSTDFIFNGNEMLYDETAIGNAVNFYGNSKIEAEQRVMKNAEKWAIVRTSLVYGAVKSMDRSNLVLWVVNSLKNGESIKVVDDQFRCPTLAEDLATGCLLLAKNNAEGIFNIAGPDLFSVYEIALATAKTWGLDGSLITPVATIELNEPAQRPPRTYLPINKAVSELDFQAHDLQKGLQFLHSEIESYPQNNDS